MKNTNFFRLTFILLAMMISNLLPLMAEYSFSENPCGKDVIGQITSNNHFDIIDCGKRYIPMEKIALVANAILVEFEGETFQTPALYNDADGFYIENIIADRGKCGHVQWECANCHHCNSLFYSCCSKCDFHISATRFCK